MKFRIKEYPRGFVVEIQKRKWYGKKYWTHFISVAGMGDKPWYHLNYDYAEKNLLDEIKWQTAINSNQYDKWMTYI